MSTLSTSKSHNVPELHTLTHSSRIDFSDEFSFDHILQFFRLDIAFAVELGRVAKD